MSEARGGLAPLPPPPPQGSILCIYQMLYHFFLPCLQGCVSRLSRHRAVRVPETASCSFLSCFSVGRRRPTPDVGGDGVFFVAGAMRRPVQALPSSSARPARSPFFAIPNPNPNPRCSIRSTYAPPGPALTPRREEGGPGEETPRPPGGPQGSGLVLARTRRRRRSWAGRRSRTTSRA